MRYLLIGVLFFVNTINYIYSQNNYISGKVIDESTKEPLAFVNIIYNNKNQGTTTNIDGKFSIPLSENVNLLKVSYVGYESYSIAVKDIPNKKQFVIKLKKKVLDIQEITVYPGINPAHRIINKVIENRSINNPEHLNSFSYITYDKMIFTANLDTIYQKNRITLKDDILINKDTSDTTNNKKVISKEDSSQILIKRFLDYQDIMIMESVSERKFIFPDKNNQKVIASKISGLKDPTFILLATQIQSFSFYNDFIGIYEKSYLNPVSKRSINKYFFLIEDTLYNEKKDTIFIISFRPHKGRNFDGLKGILYINSNKYAIQNVIAQPNEKNIIDVKIQQKYELINNEYWFPVELNTNIIFRNLNLSEGSFTTNVLALGKSYIKDIKINEKLNKKEFNNIELKVNDDANKQNDDFWNKYRIDSLTIKDKNTYRVIDSVGKEAKLDQKVRILSNVLSGYIPYYFVNFDLAKFFDYNYYEGFRLGLGLSTNNKISKWVSVGGYFAYGTKDDAFKYGSNIDFNINENSELKLRFSYKNDVIESGSYNFLEEKSFSSTEVFRNYLIKNMDLLESKEISLSFRTLQYLKLTFFINQENKTATNNYWWKTGSSELNNGEIIYGTNKFLFTNVGLNFKFVFKEKFMQTVMGKYSLGSKYPIISGNIIKGILWEYGQYAYTKYEAKISETFTTKSFGKTSLCLVGGYIDKSIPYSNIYSGRGSYDKFAVEAANSFETMRLNEFLSDRFVSVFIRQNFGKLILRTEKIKPNIIICTNIGFGDLKHSENHYNIEYKTLNKGYFESGILINNFIKKYIAGIGVFYRYGTYSFSKPIDNFAFKLTISLNL